MANGGVPEDGCGAVSTTIRQVTLVSGLMAAQEFDVPTEAIDACRRLLSEGGGPLPTPGHPTATLTSTNGGSWTAIEFKGGRALTTYAATPTDTDRATELIALAMSEGGEINMAALTEAFRLAPIAVTWVREAPTPTIAERLSDIGGWAAWAMMEVYCG